VERIKPFTNWLHGLPETLSSSITFGSEPGVLSLGKGSLPTEAMMTINCVNRFERKETIWQIEEKIRTRLMTLNNVKVLDVYDFGATPLSSIKAPWMSAFCWKTMTVCQSLPASSPKGSRMSGA
jgi:hypothetical protein